MAPPQRALFSLNLDSDAEHVYQRVDDHNHEGTNRVKIIESKGPTHGHTDLTYITKPFEKTVNRAVNEVIDGTGKKVGGRRTGELKYSTTTSASSSSSSSGNRNRNDVYEKTAEQEQGNLAVKSKAKRRAIEDKYDISEL